MAVDLSFYKSYIAEEIREEGRTEGRAQDVLLVLEQRGLDIPDAVRSRVQGCHDPEILRHWLARAVTAAEAEGIFGTSEPAPRGGYEWPSSAESSSCVAGTEPESGDGRRGKGSIRVSSMTGGAGRGGFGMTAASEWPPQP